MKHKIITVDGPSGVGKGTIATIIKKKIGYKYLDSGSLYRSLALKLFENNNNFEEVMNNVDILIKNINIRFEYAEGKKSKVFVNEEDFTDKIRTVKVALLAS